MDIEESNPFSSLIFYYLDAFGFFVIHLWFDFLDNFAACFMWTTKEKKYHPYSRLGYCFLAAPVYFILHLITMPFGLIGYFLWIIANYFRCVEYRTSTCHTGKSSKKFQPSNIYSFGTTNVCFLPEFLSRYNNISHTPERAKMIGQNIMQQQLNVTHDKYINGSSNNTDGFLNGVEISSANSLKEALDPNSPTMNHEGKDAFNHEPRLEFPQLDFLFVQEAWNTYQARSLSAGLHQIFPYIIFDCAEHGLRENLYGMTSALLFASRHPILKAQFKRFSRTCKQCSAASKGCLLVKLDLGQHSNGKSKVGYCFNAHLQAYPGKQPIHKYQLNEVKEWTKDFRALTFNPDREIVMFDVLGGDFNLDNGSPVHQDVWDHPIFDDYRDVGRASPGQDHDWAVGTDIRHLTFFDGDFATPEGVKRALEDPYLMQYHICDSDIVDSNPSFAWKLPEKDKHGNWILSKDGGRRRIDYLMYRQADDKVKVLAYCPVAQLAGLTDHIPMVMTLDVSNVYQSK